MSAGVTIFDGFGRPVHRASASPYESSGGGRRFRHFHAPNIGPSAVVSAALDTLRNRSRAIDRSNPWGFGALDVLAANLIGAGVTPRPRMPDSALGRDAKALWDDWSLEADAAGLFTLQGLWWQSTRAWLADGEAFMRFRRRRYEDGLTVPLQVQAFEADHVPTDKNEDNGALGVTIAGIAHDALGRRTGYHVAQTHPAERGIGRVATTETKFVPAAEIAHVFRPPRVGAVRGEPMFTRTMLRLFELDAYDDAELVSKSTASRITGFITRNADTGDAEGPLGQEFERDEDDRSSVVDMEPGTFPVLEPGEDVEFAQPLNVAANFDGFTSYHLRGVGYGHGLGYEQQSGDYSRVTYSSARVARLDFQRRIAPLLWHVLVHQACRRTWDEFLTAAFLAGALPMPADYWERRRAWHRCEWMPNGHPFVDPLREAEANERMVRAGFRSRRSVIAELGGSPEATEQEIAEERAWARENGIVFDSDPNQVDNAGKSQSSADPNVVPDDPELDPSAPARRTPGAHGRRLRVADRGRTW